MFGFFEVIPAVVWLIGLITIGLCLCLMLVFFVFKLLWLESYNLGSYIENKHGDRLRTAGFKNIKISVSQTFHHLDSIGIRAEAFGVVNIDTTLVRPYECSDWFHFYVYVCKRSCKVFIPRKIKTNGLMSYDDMQSAVIAVGDALHEQAISFDGYLDAESRNIRLHSWDAVNLY